MTQVLLSDGSYAIKVVVVGQSGNIAGGGGGPLPSTADTTKRYRGHDCNGIGYDGQWRAYLRR